MNLKNKIKLNYFLTFLAVEMCKKYNISAEDFVDQWSSFTVSNKYDIKPTRELLNMMERKCLKKKLHLDNNTSNSKQTSVGNFAKENNLYPCRFIVK